MNQPTFDFAELFYRSAAAQAVLNDRFEVVLANTAFWATVGPEVEQSNHLTVLDLFAADGHRKSQVRTAFSEALGGQPARLSDIWCPLYDRNDPTAEPVDKCWTIDCVPLTSLDGSNAIFLLRIENTADHAVVARRREAVGAEFRHRAGNLLTILQVIARTTLQDTGVNDQDYAAFESRIDALSHAHSVEIGHYDGDIALSTIIEQQMKSQRIAAGDKVTLAGEAWRLPVIHAQMFALAVRELFANAVQFGALSQPQGKITMSWGRAADGTRFFHWMESDLTDIAASNANGFGQRMLCRILPNQMGAQADWQLGDHRVDYKLTLPSADQ